MTEEARLRRKKRDHERYMKHREERLAWQRAYYKANRDSCIASVKRSKRKRFIRELYGRDTDDKTRAAS